MVELEANACKLTGCDARCCRNPWLYFFKQKEVQDFFHEAKYVPYEDLAEITVPGVWFTFEGKMVLVHIVGDCPHLTPENDCDIHEDKPESCEELITKNGQCWKFRMNDTSAWEDFLEILKQKLVL